MSALLIRSGAKTFGKDLTPITIQMRFFVAGLMAARPAPDRRYALLNNQFAVHHLSGRTEKRVLASAAEMRETLEGAFGLTLPDAPELDAALERLTTPA